VEDTTMTNGIHKDEKKPKETAQTKDQPKAEQKQGGKSAEDKR